MGGTRAIWKGRSAEPNKGAAPVRVGSGVDGGVSVRVGGSGVAVGVTVVPQAVTSSPDNTVKTSSR